MKQRLSDEVASKVVALGVRSFLAPNDFTSGGGGDGGSPKGYLVVFVFFFVTLVKVPRFYIVS